MPIELTMPRLSDTMESGTLLKWNVQEGDAVSSGDIVADVETDKATMELTVYDGGTVASIVVAEGQTVEVGSVIALIAEDGEDPAAIVARAAAAAEASAAAADAGTDVAAVEHSAVYAARAADGGRLRISPVARRLADEHGIDVRHLNGSGPGARIIKRDVLGVIEAAQETSAARAPSAAAPPALVQDAPGAPPALAVPVTPAAPPSVAPPAVAPPPAASAALAAPGGPSALTGGIVPLSSMRQTIARRLVESTTTIPHYQVTMTFNMEPMLNLRKTLNEQLTAMDVKLSVNDFLVRCCALAMYRHPEFNASWNGDSIIVHGDVNIGIAISVGPERGGGLVVGVIHNADRKSLRAISAESRALAVKARERGLTVEEMTGATFTLSNLGMFGVDHFTAIINPPNSAILAVGAAVQKPVVRDGALAIGHEMSATLSNDHRVIDGATAAQYLQTLKEYVENPASVLV